MKLFIRQICHTGLMKSTQGDFLCLIIFNTNTMYFPRILKIFQGLETENTVFGRIALIDKFLKSHANLKKSKNVCYCRSDNISQSLLGISSLLLSIIFPLDSGTVSVLWYLIVYHIICIPM
jgi:hypothetical protein